MTVSIRVCRSIAVSPDALWALLEPIEDHPRWMADAESIEFLGPSRRGVGTEFRCVTKVGPIRLDDVMRVTRWEPGAAMGIEHVGLVVGHGVFLLAPEAAGTRLCWEERLTFPWWLGGRLGEIVGRVVLARIWRANLERLEELAT